MNVTYECGGVEIAVRDGGLFVNGDEVATFPTECDAVSFSVALSEYGDAMWAEGHQAREAR